MLELFVITGLIPFVVYATAWISSTAYFNAKMAYQKRLYLDLSKRDFTTGG